MRTIARPSSFKSVAVDRISVRSEPRPRVAFAGAQLRILVLAVSPDGCVGVDLASGAFVRAIHPPTRTPLEPLDVVTAEMNGAPDPPDYARPEAIDLMGAPERTGRMGPRRAAHYFDALMHPDGGPLLGFSGPAIPFWTLSGDRPSLTMVTAAVGPQIRWNEDGFQCRFAWQGLVHELPLGDERLIAAMHRQRRTNCAGRDLERVAGYRPRRLLVMLTPPVDGYCHKLVAGLLPGR